MGLITETPFEIYKTFVIEEKYGFNKTTVATFVKDFFISVGLGFIFVPLISFLAVQIINWAGESFFIYVWAFGVVTIVILMLIWPNFIAPLFNKFEILGDKKITEETSEEEKSKIVKEKDLREKIEKIAKEVNFPISEIYTMDGSKRSAHSQAYFFGIFKKKRIVIYDTLIDQSTNLETEAVVFHEIGHWFHSHNIQLLGATFLQFALIAYTMQIIINKNSVYHAFGLEKKEIYMGITLCFFIINPVSFLANFIR